MSGYTPVFDTVYHGTLCGKWPTLPVWLTILPMADKHGHIDLTYQAIAVLTGWPIDLLKQAFAELMAPDPESRSADEDGRRLVLIDPENRSWGWRVVNHRVYREKARKQQSDQNRVENGSEAARKAQSRAVPRCPAQHDLVPPSDTDTNTNSKKAAPLETELASIKAEYPKRAGDNQWQKARKCLNARLAEGHSLEDILAGVRRYANFCKHTGKVGTEFVMQASRFLGKDEVGFTKPWDIPAKLNGKHSGETAEQRRARIYGNASS